MGLHKCQCVYNYKGFSDIKAIECVHSVQRQEGEIFFMSTPEKLLNT